MLIGFVGLHEVNMHTLTTLNCHAVLKINAKNM